MSFFVICNQLIIEIKLAIHYFHFNLYVRRKKTEANLA